MVGWYKRKEKKKKGFLFLRIAACKRILKGAQIHGSIVQ